MVLTACLFNFYAFLSFTEEEVAAQVICGPAGRAPGAFKGGPIAEFPKEGELFRTEEGIFILNEDLVADTISSFTLHRSKTKKNETKIKLIKKLIKVQFTLLLFWNLEPDGWFFKCFIREA